MSWPRLAFRVKDPSLFKPNPNVPWDSPRICWSIYSWDGEVAQCTSYDGPRADPKMEVRHAVRKEDIIWVNTEAAIKFPFAQAGVKVIGVGYKADEKLEGFEASKPK